KLSRDLWHLGEADEVILRRMVENQARYTASRRAQALLDNWPEVRTKFVKVFPKEYRRALGELAEAHRKAAA
ncbi:MAG TPA: hypothetical protein VIS73_12875, partial [Rhodocyclaceae bacterium]